MHDENINLTRHLSDRIQSEADWIRNEAVRCLVFIRGVGRLLAGVLRAWKYERQFTILD